jgi:thiol-disulfide isomerase/thioredoxin|uniref:Thioredoxin domain-containing protein n=1 Tax=viral metagenome TaxID=1070528 RepID=A0A6C0IPH5_9ZZZZ
MPIKKNTSSKSSSKKTNKRKSASKSAKSKRSIPNSKSKRTKTIKRTKTTKPTKTKEVNDTKISTPSVHNSPVLTKPKVVLFLVFAEWCGHCQQLKPEWNAMKTELLMNNNEDFDITEIEDVNKDTLLPEFKDKYLDQDQHIEIKGFPTLGGIKNGKYYEYDGGSRTKEDLIKFAHKLNSGLY